MRVNEITMLRECRKNISSLSGIHRKKDGLYNLELHRSALLFITDHLQGMEEKKRKETHVTSSQEYCCKAAGFDQNQFSAHSLRLGFLMQNSSY
jgi:hypothetical protein